MRNLYRLSFAVFAACGFMACKSSGNYLPVPNNAQNLIVGRWTLQKQEFVQYADGVEKVDTVLNATQFSLASIQFNNDGTFSSSSMYASGNSGNLSGGVINASDDSHGTYAFAGSVFSISAPIAGFSMGGNSLVFGSGGSVPVITPVSNSIKIVQLTSSKLNLHAEYVYTYTAGSVSQTYKTENDYYYTK
ncbi:MAG: hypothetical protein JST19_06075 [Bacteroidetes bacterium]|nr:hypothetical protein [Bacteroidota bacterium]